MTSEGDIIKASSWATKDIITKRFWKKQSRVWGFIVIWTCGDKKPLPAQLQDNFVDVFLCVYAYGTERGLACLNYTDRQCNMMNHNFNSLYGESVYVQHPQNNSRSPRIEMTQISGQTLFLCFPKNPYKKYASSLWNAVGYLNKHFSIP